MSQEKKREIKGMKIEIIGTHAKRLGWPIRHEKKKKNKRKREGKHISKSAHENGGAFCCFWKFKTGFLVVLKQKKNRDDGN